MGSNDDKTLGHAEFDLSMKVMKELAEAAAKSAATEIASTVRQEMRDESQKLRDELVITIKEEIKSYHGDMTPTEHAIQHNRMDRLLNWTDKLSQNFWGQLLTGVVKWVVIIFLIGYFALNSGLAKVPGVPG